MGRKGIKPVKSGEQICAERNGRNRQKLIDVKEASQVLLPLQFNIHDCANRDIDEDVLT